MKFSDFKLLINAAERTAQDEKPDKALNAILKDCKEKIKVIEEELEGRRKLYKEEMNRLQKRIDGLQHEEIYLGNGEDDDF